MSHGAALDGGPGGYVIFERLAEQALRYLKSGGCLIVEMAPRKKASARHFASHVELRIGPTIFDHSGHPRVLKAQRTSRALCNCR